MHGDEPGISRMSTKKKPEKALLNHHVIEIGVMAIALPSITRTPESRRCSSASDHLTLTDTRHHLSSRRDIQGHTNPFLSTRSHFFELRTLAFVPCALCCTWWLPNVPVIGQACVNLEKVGWRLAVPSHRDRNFAPLSTHTLSTDGHRVSSHTLNSPKRSS